MKQPLGTIINSATLADFTQSGSATWVQNADNIGVTGGGASFYTEDAIKYSYHSALNDVEFSTVAKVNTVNGTSYGFGIGVISSNTDFKRSCVVALNCTNGANKGKITIFDTEANVQVAIGTSALSFSAGENIFFNVRRNGNTLVCTAINMDTPNMVEFTHEFDFVIAPNYMWNTGKYSIVTGGGSYNFYDFRVISEEIEGNDHLGIGDSITFGVFAGKYDWSWFNRLFQGSLYNYTINAGGGDTTESVLNRQTEILRLLKPRGYAHLMIGGNDLGFGVSQATYEARYISICEFLRDNNRKVIHYTPTKREGTDMTVLRDFIYDYATANNELLIDTFSLFGSTASNPDDIYLVDNAHPNPYGAMIIAEYARPILGDRIK